MFGDLVRAHRRQRGWTQEDLAAKTGVSVTSIGKIEAGRVAAPRQSTVARLADAFELADAERRTFCTAAAEAPPEAPHPGVVPSQLPVDAPDFTGRRQELRELAALVERVQAADPPMLIATISGTAGVGKTTLAVHFAHRHAHRFPDGNLYVNLGGFNDDDHLPDTAEVIRDLLDGLGVPPQRVPPSVSAQAALYRTLLATRRVLVVLDNARDAAQVRPLLPGSSGCLIVVTSRNQLMPLTAAYGAYPITLDLLTQQEARSLIAQRLGDTQATADRAAVDRIIAACARLPLALGIAIARARQTGFPLSALAAELGGTNQRLDVLDAGDATSQIRAVFSWSYTLLTPAAARMFRLLSLSPSPDLTPATAASLAGTGEQETRRLLTELTKASLLIEHPFGRYGFHDLLRAYAGTLLEQDPVQVRQAATARLLDYCTHSAHAAARTLYPQHDRMPLHLPPPVEGCRPEQFADHRNAMAWFTAEHHVLLAVLRHAADSGFPRQAWQLAWSVTTYLNRRVHWQDLAAVWRTAVTVSAHLDDPAAQGYALRMLGTAQGLHGELTDAERHLRAALHRYTGAGDLTGQADTHRSLAYLEERRGRTEVALDHARQAYEHYLAAGHRRGQALALNLVGRCRTLLDDPLEALICGGQALAVIQQFGDRFGEAETWNTVGLAHLKLGHHTEAAGCHRQAIGLYQDLGDRYEEAATLVLLAQAQRAAGNAEQAEAVQAQAATIFEELDHPM